VTVDDDVAAAVGEPGDGNISAIVNDALAEHVDRQRRRAALRELLDEQDAAYGPVPEADVLAARAAFDELDAVVHEGTA
jgi:hypothetical protein